MANPNLTTLAALYGKASYLSVTTTITNILSNALSSNQLFKINAVMVTNTSTYPVTVTLRSLRLLTVVEIVSQLIVPPQTTIKLNNKNNFIYLEEGDTLQISSSHNDILKAVVSYEIIASTIPSTTTSYIFSSVPAIAYEGRTYPIVVNTIGVSDGTTLYWTNSGTAVAADFTSSVNSGSFVVRNNSGYFNINIASDTTTEVGETVILNIRTGSTSGTIVATSSTITLSDYNPLGTQNNPATSAAAILAEQPTATDGVYWIDLPTVGPTQVYCIMNSSFNGGGWMLAMKATRGTTFNYSSSYWTAINTLNPSDLTQNDGDAKYDVMNYFSAKDIMARFPDIGSGGSIAGLGAWTWLENDFNGGTRQALTSFFNTPSTATYTSPTNGGSGYFIRDAKTFSGWASGTFSSQVDIRFYGFNYINNPSYGTNAKVRWGFGWNENGEGLFPGSSGSYRGSNDVSGGIGMDSSYGNYSAGDYISCCQDTTGINRSARVEIYVR